MKIGIIGGSGFYALSMLTDVKEEDIDTPFGKPSAPIVCGKIGDNEVLFLSRHGKGHKLSPSALPHKANIYALKKLGAERILAITAVGSLKEDRKPGDIVVPDQYFDRTKQNHTFFENGIVAHLSFGDPSCEQWRNFVHSIADEFTKQANPPATAYNGGTYVCMEGPVFSTRAESNYYRSFGFDVIGMTSLPEAKLAREAEICYCALSLVTDYDCWKEHNVTADGVMQQMKQNVEVATKTVVALLERLSTAPACSSGCPTALVGAIVTSKDNVPAQTLKDLEPIVGKRVN